MTPKPKIFNDQALVKIRAVDDSIVQDGLKEVVAAELWVDNAGVWTKMTQPGVGGGGGGVAQVQVRSAGNVWTDVGYAGGDLRLPVDGSGVTQPISAVSLPLPTGAAQDRTTAAAPAAVRLTDGASFYDSRARTWTITETVPVSGTFFQATQPISAVSLPLPTGAALDATLTNRTQKAQVTDGTRDGTVKAASTLAVATDTALVVAIRDSVAVTGTFFQATQPISAVSLPLPTGAATSALQTTISGQLPAALVGARLDTNIGAWLGSTLPTVAQKAMASSIPVAIASDQSAVPITPPTLTKGTQGATGVSTQQLHDAGRNTRIFMLDAYTAAPLVEAVQSVVQWYGNAAVATSTQPAVVPAGKTLRLTGYKIMYQSLAAAGYAVIRIRANTGGLGVLASPLVASFEAGSAAAVAGVVTTETGSFPEGLELPAATGLAFSMAGYGATGALTLEGGVRFEVHGYEY